MSQSSGSQNTQPASLPRWSIRRLVYGKKTLVYELFLSQRDSIECFSQPNRLRVLAPMNTLLSDVEAYLIEQLDLSSGSQPRKRQRNRAGGGRKRMQFSDGQQLCVDEQPLTVRFCPGAHNEVHIEGDLLLVTGSAPQETLRAFLMKLAKQRLTELTEYYAPIIGKTPGRITIREQKTRWGSCSSIGNLNYNWILILKPRAAMEYVVVHELCHFYHFNHSPAFWAKVASFMPDWEERRKLLR